MKILNLGQDLLFLGYDVTDILCNLHDLSQNINKCNFLCHIVKHNVQDNIDIVTQDVQDSINIVTHNAQASVDT